MKMQNKWVRGLVIVLTLAVMSGVAVVTVPGVAQAAASLAGPFGLGPRASAGDELLADALGITVDELDAAQLDARDAALAQAVADGEITQEEADLTKARWAFDAFVSERVQAAYDQAVADAVTEGIVTQEQADTFTQPGGDFMGRGMGRGFMGQDLPDDAQPGALPMRPGGGTH